MSIPQAIDGIDGMEISPSTAVLLVAATPVIGIAFLVIIFLLTTRKHLSPLPAPRWFAASPQKRWGEKFFLWYSPFWICFVALIVASGAYEHFAHVEYMVVCLSMAAPCVLLPLLLQPRSELALPFTQRYIYLGSPAWG